MISLKARYWDGSDKSPHLSFKGLQKYKHYYKNATFGLTHRPLCKNEYKGIPKASGKELQIY